MTVRSAEFERAAMRTSHRGTGRVSRLYGSNHHDLIVRFAHDKKARRDASSHRGDHDFGIRIELESPETFLMHAIAERSSLMPFTGGYWLCPSSIARIADALSPRVRRYRESLVPD